METIGQRIRAEREAQKISRPALARMAMACVDAFVAGYDDWAAREVAKEAKRLIRRNGPVTAKVGPRIVALRLMHHLAGERLRYGDLHIYRGTLSFQGELMLGLFDALMDVRQKIGDPEAAPIMAITEKGAIRHQIAQAG